MKKLVIVVFLLCSIFLVSAETELHDFNVGFSYNLEDSVEGILNVTIEDEPVDLNVSTNFDQSMSLKDLLNKNKNVYSCEPSDCKNGYDYSNAEKSKQISLDSEELVGFVLSGEGIEVSGLRFDLGSDFSESLTSQLKLDMFGDVWEFSEYSDSFSSVKDFGCFNISNMEEGPLIRTSSYCEKISVSKTPSLRLGALVNLADDEDLVMSIYSDLSGAYLGECVYNPNNEDDCVVNTGEEFQGEYYVCVSSDVPTDYTVYVEEDNYTCGYVYPDSSDKDYAVFARQALYASADYLEVKEVDYDSFVESANNYISSKYWDQCSDGCVLPIKISGIDQGLVIENITIDYKKSGEDHVEENVYDLEVKEALLNYEGLINLSLSGFNISSDKERFNLYFGDDELIDEPIEVISGILIRSIAPRNPPAGVEVSFYVDVDSDFEIDRYVWDFGDGTKIETENSSAKHLYSNLSSYSLNVEVYAGNYSDEKTFSIVAGSPRVVLNKTFKAKQEALDSAENDVGSFPLWYQEDLKDMSEVEIYQEELSRLKREKESAYEDVEYLDIALELEALNVPSKIYIGENQEMPYIPEMEVINPEAVVEFAGGSSDSVEGYKNSIMQWQLENLEGSVGLTKINLIDYEGDEKDLMNVYDLTLTSNYDKETYLFIDKKLEDLYFESETARKVGEYSVFVLQPNEERSFSFYTDSEVGFFVSPKLSLLPLDVQIDACNFNGVCEEGENPDNCRNDCKPIGWTIFYLFLLFFIALIVYTALQVWYKSRYESHLFKDRKQLFNLVMYITNARARGMSDKEIVKQLKDKKWSKERINYALGKAKGEKVGMYEFIPIEKIFAYFRNKRVKENIATENAQQNSQNFNKSNVRGINRW